jgi:hypothetical protein
MSLKELTCTALGYTDGKLQGNFLLSQLIWIIFIGQKKNCGLFGIFGDPTPTERLSMVA